MPGKKTAAAEQREKVQADITAWSEDLSQKLAVAEQRADYLDTRIAAKKAEARANATANKRKAVAAVKRVKALEKQQEQVWQIQGKMQGLLDEIQQAVNNIDVLVAMRQQGELIDNMFAANGLNQAEVDRLADEQAERKQLLGEINDVVFAPGADEVDNDEMEADLERLLNEEEPAQAQAQPQAAPGRQAAAAAEDGAIADLMAAFADKRTFGNGRGQRRGGGRSRGSSERGGAGTGQARRRCCPRRRPDGSVCLKETVWLFGIVSRVADCCRAPGTSCWPSSGRCPLGSGDPERMLRSTQGAATHLNGLSADRMGETALWLHAAMREATREEEVNVYHLQ
jgi:hypothetical protein